MNYGQLNAEIGRWYRMLDNPSTFEVVAIDEGEQSIELQYFDGEITAIDFSDWKSSIPINAAPPEDWSAPFEMDRQDLSTDEAFQEYQISDVLQQFEMNRF